VSPFWTELTSDPNSKFSTRPQLPHRLLHRQEQHSGELRRDTAEAKAERILGEELGGARLGWEGADLVSRRKSGPARLGIAARLRRETTLPIKAMARRMDLGTSKSANIR